MIRETPVHTVPPTREHRRCRHCGGLVYLITKSRGTKRSPQCLLVDCKAPGLVHPTATHAGKGVVHDCPMQP